jgi:hypothetical protein
MQQLAEHNGVMYSHPPKMMSRVLSRVGRGWTNSFDTHISTSMDLHILKVWKKIDSNAKFPYSKYSWVTKVMADQHFPSRIAIL